jgi:cytochrome c-type biogenesis protein CcmH/NrfG
VTETPSAPTGARGGSSAAVPVRRRRLDADVLADLEEQLAVLLRSLDDLDREHAAGELDDADHATLRDEATRRAAELVRAIESGRIEIAARPRPSRVRLLAGGVAVAVVALAAGLAVANASGSREVGETSSGEIRDLTDDRLQEASELARAGDVQGALDLYDGVLADDPDNVEALAERGLLLASLSEAAGLPDLLGAGRASVERALEVDPGNPRSLFYLGLIERLEGDEAAAVATLEEALDADPPPALRRNIEGFLGDPADSRPRDGAPAG